MHNVIKVCQFYVSICDTDSRLLLVSSFYVFSTIYAPTHISLFLQLTACLPRCSVRLENGGQRIKEEHLEGFSVSLIEV